MQAQPPPDCTRLAGDPSIIDLDVAADGLAADRTGPRLADAIVMPTSPKAGENGRFRELACDDRGLSVRLFNHRDEALAWLLP